MISCIKSIIKEKNTDSNTNHEVNHISELPAQELKRAEDLC
jgi:hypothetical protein